MLVHLLLAHHPSLGKPAFSYSMCFSVELHRGIYLPSTKLTTWLTTCTIILDQEIFQMENLMVLETNRTWGEGGDDICSNTR